MVDEGPGVGFGLALAVGLALAAGLGLADGPAVGESDAPLVAVGLELAVGLGLGLGLALGLALESGLEVELADGVPPALGSELRAGPPPNAELAAGGADDVADADADGVGDAVPLAAGVAVGATVGVADGSADGVGEGRVVVSSIVPPNLTPFGVLWTEPFLNPGSRRVIVYDPTDIWASWLDGSAVETSTCLSLAFWPRSQPEPAVDAMRVVSIGCQLPLASL